MLTIKLAELHISKSYFFLNYVWKQINSERQGITHFNHNNKKTTLLNCWGLKTSLSLSLWRISASKEFDLGTTKDRCRGERNCLNCGIFSNYRQYKQLCYQFSCLYGWGKSIAWFADGHAHGWTGTHTFYNSSCKQSACCEFAFAISSRSTSSLRGF